MNVGVNLRYLSVDEQKDERKRYFERAEVRKEARRAGDDVGVVPLSGTTIVYDRRVKQPSMRIPSIALEAVQRRMKKADQARRNAVIPE